MDLGEIIDYETFDVMSNTDGLVVLRIKLKDGTYMSCILDKANIKWLRIALKQAKELAYD